MTDSQAQFAAATTVGRTHISALRNAHVARTLVDVLQERGERLMPVGNDSRGRINYYATPGAKAVQMNKMKAGKMLRALFINLHFHGDDLVLCQRAAKAGTWASIAEEVAQQMFRAGRDDTASVRWVIQRLEKADTKDYLVRNDVLAEFIKEFPGIPSVRGRELGFALRHLGISDISSDPRPRIDGQQVRVIWGVRWKTELSIRNDNPFVT